MFCITAGATPNGFLHQSDFEKHGFSESPVTGPQEAAFCFLGAATGLRQSRVPQSRSPPSLVPTSLRPPSPVLEPQGAPEPRVPGILLKKTYVP